MSDYRRGQFYRFVDPMYGLSDPEDVPVDDIPPREAYNTIPE